MRSAWLYRDRRTILHRLHPTTKLLGMLLLFVAAFAFNQPLYVLPLVIVALALIGVARAWDNLRASAWFMLLLFVMTILLWSLFLDGVEKTWAWGPFGLSPTSLMYGLAVGLRLVFLLLVGLVFLSTTAVEDGAYALRQMRFPEPVLLAFTLAFRLVPNFTRSAMAAADAQRSRGLELDRGGPVTRLRRYVPLMVPVVARGLRSADDLTRALETRGISSGRRRSHLQRYAAGAADVLVVIVLLAIVAGLLWLRITAHVGELLPRV